jgi:4-hydroxy-3-polyprenylbenzoate decarboxylase
MTKRIVIGISGASGVIYGIRLLEVLHDRPEIETHLVVSDEGARTIKIETGRNIKDVIALATRHYDISNLAAAVSSGSFRTDGMAIIPCSMKTLAGIATGYSDNLLTRAADVTLKERRTLVLVPRESPLHAIHLENLLKLARMNAIILPPDPPFYIQPKTLDDIIDYVVGKTLDYFSIEHDLFQRWQGG